MAQTPIESQERSPEMLEEGLQVSPNAVRRQGGDESIGLPRVMKADECDGVARNLIAVQALTRSSKNDSGNGPLLVRCFKPERQPVP